VPCWNLFGPRGTMSLNFVTVAGQRIACLFTMEDGHTLYAAKIGFDPAYAAISPGHLMVAQTAADAERRGLKVFDFLGAASEWNLKWTHRLRSISGSSCTDRQCAATPASSGARHGNTFRQNPVTVVRQMKSSRNLKLGSN